MSSDTITPQKVAFFLKLIKIKLDSKGLKREFLKFSPAREGLMMIGDF